jgi:hypothetical protein
MVEKNLSVEEINDFIQKKLKQLNIKSASPVEATRWLIDAGLRDKMNSRPGSYLRVLCRKGKIKGAQQQNKSWTIKRL